MATGRPGQEATGQCDDAAGDDVDDDESERHRCVLAPSHQPGQERVSHSFDPGERVQSDPEGGSREVEGVQGEAVVELTVVTRPGSHRQVRRDAGARGVF
jgi:hypothetical protein